MVTGELVSELFQFSVWKGNNLFKNGVEMKILLK